VENRPSADNGKYVTLAVLLAIVAAIFLWTLISNS
jgi:hypothetical protein